MHFNGGSFMFWSVSCVFIAVTYHLLNFVYTKQSNPYIDEIFHIPQAQNYCKGLFNKWNAKITTLPGLYILSVGLLTPLSYIWNQDLCQVYHLRLINFLGYCGNLFLIYNIHSKLFKRNHQNSNNIKDIFSSINISLFPLLYFFTFFYYTETISTFLVLLAYRLFLNDLTNISAFIGFISICVRQTNIIWIIFIMLLSIFSMMKEVKIRHKKQNNWPEGLKYIGELFYGAQSIYRSGFTGWKLFLSACFAKMGSYLIVCIFFGIFVLWNGSIVVGDQSAHQAVIHLPQIFYFCMFTLIFASPLLLNDLRDLNSFIWNYRKMILVLTILSIFIIKYNTHVHLYLISDNRHYSFYIWKKVYEKHYLIKYFLIPLYIFALMAIINKLKSMNNAFQLTFILCTCLIIVPQKLVEFRYFIQPYLMFRMHMHTNSWKELIFEFLIYALINVITIYIFATKTFKWNDSDELQRIIW